MADPYEGLSADEWRKALAEVRAQIPGMRAEAAALNEELASGRTTMRQIEAEGRRQARIGAAASKPPASATPEATAAATERQARASKQVAAAEGEAAAARARSADQIRRIGLLSRVGPYPTFTSPAARTRIGQNYLDLLRAQGAAGGGGAINPALIGRPGQLALPRGAIQLPSSTPKPPSADPSYVQGVSAAEKATEKASTSTAAFSSNLQRNQAVMASSSREMRKFGALTTEFISTAGRGAVTVRELGYQVASTVGKFGGWLVAGGAVYTAFGAIQALGKGAIDAQSGVAQLQRVVNNVDASRATQQFRDLAEHYNLPIEDVTNASFEMGKVFKSQDDALEATKAILASVKVGELDVATSSRYLTSTIQAFKLPASDMAGVFDQINQAQNLFGIRIGDSLAGLAKASGTFKAAGGDLSTLLALITTARRATGQTGEVIGTALSRAPNFLRQTSNQQILRDFGIDASANIDDIMEQAFQKAGTLSGPKIQELAAAIFGPQYGARIGTPLLQQADLYQKVLKDTSPEASKGSAERELQSVLAQTSEQLQKVINQLQSLGAGLAEAGAFDALGGLLKALNGILTLANNIVSIFNTLPEIFRKAIVYAGQLAGVIALSRRFNIGESFGGREGGFLGRTLTRRDQSGFLYKEGLIGQRDSLAKESEASAATAVKRSLQVEASRLAVAEETAALSRLTAAQVQGQVVTEEAMTEAKQRVAAAEAQLAAAREAEMAAMTQNKAILQEQLIVQNQLVALRSGANAEQLAAQYGVISPSRVGPNLDDAAGLRGAPGIGGPEYIDRASFGKPFIPPGQSRFAPLMQNMRELGVVAGTMRTANETVRRGATSLMSKLSLARIGGGLQSMGTRLMAGVRGFASYISYLDAVLIGVFILADGLSKARGLVDEVNQIKEAPTDDLSSYEEAARSLSEKSKEGYSALGIIAGAKGATQDAAAELDRRSAERTKELLALIEGETPASQEYVYEEDLQNAVDLIGSAFRNGTENLKQQAQRTRNFIRAVRQNGHIEEGQKQELIVQARTAQVESAGLKASYGSVAALAGEDLGKQITEYGKAVGSGLGTQAQRRKLLTDALIQGAELFRSKDPADIGYLDQAFDDAVSGITDAAQKELDYQLAFAKGQKERNEAYADYFRATQPQEIKQRADQLIAEQRAKLKDNEQIMDRLKKDQADAARDALKMIWGSDNPELGRSLYGVVEALKRFGGKDPGAIDDELKRRAKDSKAIRERIKEIRESQEEAAKRIKAIRKEIQVQRFEENQALIEARGSLREGAADEGLPALRVALNTIGRLLENAIKQYGRNSKEVLDLLAQQREAREAIVEEQLNLIQARGDYQQAGLSGAGQETAKAKAEIQNLQQQLAFMQAHPQQYSAADILGIQAQIREAQVQLAEDAKQEAEDLKNALYDIRIARANAAGNEVAAARAELAKALYALRTADTKVERKQARAEVINQRAAVRDAIFNAQVEDIEFQADIGKLTLQQQIRQYQQLLKTAELTRDQRRDLRRKIADLKSQAEQEAGSFDLDLGNIKLPTIYEIRRAIQGGVGGNQNNVMLSQTNTYNVNGANADEIVNQIAARQADAARRNRNQARSAGII